MAWTIKGQAGKALNAGSRTLAELAITKCDLVYRSAAADTLSWTAVMTDATGGGVIIPDFQQQVEIFYGSTRRFIGYVSGVRTGLRTVQVQVSNVWWLMEQEDLTSVVTDDNGGTAERHKYVAAKAGLTVQIGGLIYRCAELGLPLAVGGVGAMFPNTRMTLAKMSCAQGLTKLLQRCPDAVTRFDYANTSGTSPWLQVWRRSGDNAMPDVTYTIGVSPIVRGETDLQSRLDQRVSRVELNYLDRHPTTGRVRFQSQANGTGAVGETQRITIAGDELVPFMPDNEYETFEMQTATDGQAFVNATESSLVAARATYGSAVSVATGAASYGFWNSWSTNAAGAAHPNEEYGATTVDVLPSYFVAKSGSTPSLTGWYFVTKGNIPDWVRKLPGISLREGTYYGSYRKLFSQGTPGETPTETVWTPGWVTALGMTRVVQRAWLANTTTLYDMWTKNFAIPCTLINADFSSQTTLYKPFTYNFEQCTPESGMASGMRIAQDWVPWEGRMVLAPGDEVDGANLMGHAVNLAGSLPACATMRALPKQLAYDLIKKRMVYTLGAPTRLDFGTSSGRVPGSSQDVVDFT